MTHATADSGHKSTLASLALGALGVVYGDIGTSPLYSVRECFHGLHAIATTPDNVLGVLSLIFWSLAVVVTLKYVVFILRADSKGEGGIFALMALLPGETQGRGLTGKKRAAIILAGIFGAALLYGDGIITPAISVLSAVEGLEVATPAAQQFVIPITCLILIGLFTVQSRGTARIGMVFGPIMLLWFAVLAVLGIWEMTKVPEVLTAVNPAHAWRFFSENGFHGIVVLGSVVLCITGGEALYADLGHFSKSSIRLSWMTVVWPALLCNYFGQGALLLTRPDLAFNPFYSLTPRLMLYPMVALSTAATVIASQAMISGVYSLTQQAIQLGFLPRMQVIHTSAATKGQIYMPEINWGLLLACLALVLTFKTSSGLAGAYGIAVTATMGITSIIYFFVVTRTWNWSPWRALLLVGLFLSFDLTYFGANLLKVFDGGWFTLTVAAAVTLVMASWRQGRAFLAEQMARRRLPMTDFLGDVARSNPPRIAGTAIFMSVSPTGVPPTLLHHFKFNKVFHDRVVILSIQTAEVPYVFDQERVEVADLGQGFFRILAYYGFRETPNVLEIIRLAGLLGLKIDARTATYYLSRETLLTTGQSKMALWRKRLFTFMSRNAMNPTIFFNLPPDRVVELGIQLQI